MRVAVIGGSGHIGTYLSPRLVEAGADRGEGLLVRDRLDGALLGVIARVGRRER